LTEGDVEGVPARGGRLGNAATRAQNAQIAKELEEKEGLKVTHGDDVGKEEYIPGEGPGTTGGTFADITAKNPQIGKTVRVQTIDTHADGTPTDREQDAIDRILKAFPDDELRIIAKRKTP
jgi:filamentous hemagglutinin